MKEPEKNKAIKNEMHSGKIYNPSNIKLMLEQFHYLDSVRKYNKTHCSPIGILIRQLRLKRMFAEIGRDCYIEPPFHSNFGGRHTHFGDYVYANYNLTLVDDTHIFVGDRVMLGPNVTLATAGHPVLPEFREQSLQFNMPIRIGDNCWLGAGVIVLPGVTIGENSVIGAGSIVTKDIPANVVAVGNPCRVLREIGEKDRQFYYKDMQIPQAILDKYTKNNDN